MRCQGSDGGDRTLTNPALVRALYDAVYRLANAPEKPTVQLLLIDSDLVVPRPDLEGFGERRMAGEEGSPALIPYYNGP